MESSGGGGGGGGNPDSAAAEAIRKAREIAARLSAQTQVHALPVSSASSSAGVGGGVGVGAAADGSGAAGTNGSSGSASHKRKRWGVLPSDGINNNTASSDEANSHKKLLLSSSSADEGTGATAAAPMIEPITRRVWVTVTSEKPAAHFMAFGRRQIPGILERITGEKQPEVTSEDEGGDDDGGDDEGEQARKKREEKDNDDPTKLTISFQGKGANPHKPVLPGMPEEPLHCRIRGPSKLHVEEAETAVEDMLQEAALAPTDTEAVAAHERALAVTQSLSLDQIMASAAAGSGGGGYRPASVAALIHGGKANSNSTSLALPADKLAAALLHGSTAASVTRTIGVPNGLVGFLIGRGGENIARMQALTGCRVQIQKEHELLPGQAEREITLSAATDGAVADCERLIRETVAERSSAIGNGGRGGGGGGGGGAAAAVAAGVSIEVDVPDKDVGLIIGKMGATIKSIQEESGANIQVPKMGNVNDPTKRTLTITHPNEQGANLAKQLVERTLASKPTYANSNSNQNQHHSSNASIQVLIPDKDVGLCIGRQGCVIKHMQGTTQCRIQIPPHPPPGHTHRIATVTGPSPEACAAVQQMIDRIVREQSSAGVMSGTPMQPGGAVRQQPQQGYYGAGAGAGADGPQEHQQGYSAEWAAYHAAQQAAQQQQQQQQQAAAVAPAAAQQQPGADAYYEQFFRYAYYYGEDAARKHYGAWSPSPGTPNPYGVNPAGIAPAPATAAATAAGAAAAPAAAPVAAAPAPAAPAPAPAPATDTSEARETGRRHVSNLPAWMTQKA